MKYIEYYKCNECGSKWRHEWDTEDYNNDYTQCPQGCEEFDFDEIENIMEEENTAEQAQRRS